MTNDYNDGQIWGWNGGACPVHPETMVEAWFRGGGSSVTVSNRLFWPHSDKDGDIIAFKVVKPYVELKVIWIVRDILGKGSKILYVGDREDAARSIAGINPENRLVEKYVEAQE